MCDVTSKKSLILCEIYLVIILYFQLQNHEYCYSGVTIVLGLQESSPIDLNPRCNIKFSILINSTIFVNLLPYVLEYRNNIVS